VRRDLPLLLAILLGTVGTANAQLRLQQVAGGFTLPIAFVQDPTDAQTQFVAQQDGHIRVIHAGVVRPSDFLDLSSAIFAGGEQGLLGLALAPDFATSGRFFVNFTDPVGNTVVSRFKRSTTDTFLADPASRFDLRWGGPTGNRYIVQPYSNHNGGHLAFGPDGFLYIGLGDGGSGNDPESRAQNPAEYLGKMLRIDVSVADGDSEGYRVPVDNPFVAGPAGTRPEIWSFGLRNPWRYSFDDPLSGGTGALIIGDVGQNSFEEIDYEPAGHGGRNYGWRIREGAHDNILTPPPAYLPLTDPLFDYPRSLGQTVTGGDVYRGTSLDPAYRSRYFFADFSAGRVFSLALTINQVTGEASASDLIEHTTELGGGLVGNVSSFGVGVGGELYIVSYVSGSIFKIVHSNAGPATLTATAQPAQVALSWTPVPNTTSYRVKRSTVSGTEAVIATGITGTAFQDADVVRGQTYFYVVSSVGALGESANSGEASVTLSPRVFSAVLPGDVNRDGHPDLVWRNGVTGDNVLWTLNGTTLLGQISLPPVQDLSWRVVASADINDDGRLDLVWRNVVTGANTVWFLNGTTLLGQSSLPPVTDMTWHIVASADINGDGRADLIWRNISSGANVVWYLQGTELLGEANFPAVADLTWQLVTSADMNQDGAPDLIWRNSITGANVVWYLSGTRFLSQAVMPAVADLTWRLVGALDVNLDGTPDFIWRNGQSGSNVVWFMNASGFLAQQNLPPVPDPSWQLTGVRPAEIKGDVNVDRRPDLVWRHATAGTNVVWYLDHNTLLGQEPLPAVSDPSWRIVGKADVDGDAHPDLIWRNTTTGANVIWLMNGTTIVSQVGLPWVVDINWEVAAVADMNRDTHPDLIWRHAVTGALVVWHLNGAMLIDQGVLPTEPDTAWRIVGAADMNGDTYPDLVWRNAATGQNVIWNVHDVVFENQRSFNPVTDLSWQLVSVVDINGDDKPDFVWRNSATGANVIWYMNDNVMLAQISLPTVSDAGWRISP
jgi:glucose/arabinose dehydrogenase